MTIDLRLTSSEGLSLTDSKQPPGMN